MLNWRNWERRVWLPACRRAGVATVPYDGRHTYASLLIHEGRSIPYVAAALGHTSGRMVLERYGHMFDAARLAPMAPMEESIRVARAQLLRAGVYPMCTERPVRRLRSNDASGPKPAFQRGFDEDGRYWARTSDPQLVELVLSQLS